MKIGVWFPAIRADSGTDTFTERLAAGLTAHGIRCEIAWLPLRAEYVPWSVPPPKPPHWANIVHLNSWLPPRFAPSSLPVIATIHSCVHDSALVPYQQTLQRLYHKHWIRHIEAANLKRADVVSAVSIYGAQVAQKTFGRHDIRIIHNGIATKIFQPAARDRPNKTFRLLYVGNWRVLKGVDRLGAIMRSLGCNFELHYTADRKDLHRRYLLPDNCHCLGRLDVMGLVHAYQQADALLFPTYLEGFGLTAIEAMACGLPVVASRVTALPEIIQDGANGLLCPVNDVDAFVAAARRLADSPALWRQMRQAGRARVLDAFSEEKMIAAYADLYRSMSSSRQSLGSC